jgi:murein DD-endopeptidase MepM/ murein hydrolase activator NlpD
MRDGTVRSTVRVLGLERLEDRCVLSGTLPLPFTIGGNPPDVWQTYGQWEEVTLGTHFHEGIDLIGPTGTDVTAIEGGTVVGVSAPGAAAPNQ